MASSASSPSAKMILQYDWILEDVDRQSETLASKMILFRGQRVFRVGLKNHRDGDKPPVLFFMVINLNKMGMRVKEVTYGIRDGDLSDMDGPAKMIEMSQENIADVSDQGNSPKNCGVLQLFTIELANQVIENCTFMLRIRIKGSDSGYSYRLSDRLAKEQLWAATKIKNGVDVEIVVKGKTFSAHRAILAARCPVFAAEFARFFTASLKISDVEPSTVEQFLYFIYTGEPMGTLANEELLKLARHYKLTTLARLCQVALEEIQSIQMVNVDRILDKKSDTDLLNSSKIRPDKEAEIFFNGMPTFRCGWTFDLKFNNLPSKCMMKYQNEDIFFAYITGKVEEHGENPRLSYVSHPWFHFLCAKHGSCGLKVEDIYLSGLLKGNWFKMKLKNFQKNEHLLHFISHSNVYSSVSAQVSFDVNVVSSIGNYYYEMMDGAWMTDFWIAAANQKYTDVVIHVGAVKLMDCHRVILSARSPVLNTWFNSKNNNLGIVKFDAKFDGDIVKNFLKFLYTGSLDSSPKNKQLLELASQYEVETLKNICQLATDHVRDVEEFTNSLLQLAIQQD